MVKLGQIQRIQRVSASMEQPSAITYRPTPEDTETMREEFPNLRQHDWDFTSDPTPNYNCIAFAAGVTNTPWWPTIYQITQYYWPPDVPLEETLQSFVRAFQTIGYYVCEAGNLEEDYEKIVIYTKDGVPTHAAIQIPSGAWMSKLGQWVDIQHTTPEALTSEIYGQPVQYMKRQLAGHRGRSTKKSSAKGKRRKPRS